MSSKRKLINRARHNNNLSVSARLTLDEIKAMQLQAARLPYPDELVEDFIKCQIALEKEGFYISDRKLQQLVKLLQAHALVQGDS